MIKSFSALYAGHVLEGEGVGFDGIPHDDRWYPNERLIKAFDIAGKQPFYWKTWDTTYSGWPSTISSGRATSAYPIS
jgi:hypothetical protein